MINDITVTNLFIPTINTFLNEQKNFFLSDWSVNESKCKVKQSYDSIFYDMLAVNGTRVQLLFLSMY